MTSAISVAVLSRRYRSTRALDQVSFDIEPGSMTGLLGRNGAGKTTLLRILAGQEFPSAGSVTVLEAAPVTTEHLLGRMVFVREDQRYPQYGGRFTVRHTLRAASWFYPNWDAGLASALTVDFGLPPGRWVMGLSRGMRSALGIVIGQGQIVLDAAANQVRGAATSVSGPAVAVAEFIAGRTVWDRRRFGSQESAVVAGALEDADQARARALQLRLEPLSLQQVVVHAAGATAAGQPSTHTQERTST